MRVYEPGDFRLNMRSPRFQPAVMQTHELGFRVMLCVSCNRRCFEAPRNRPSQLARIIRQYTYVEVDFSSVSHLCTSKRTNLQFTSLAAPLARLITPKHFDGWYVWCVVPNLNLSTDELTGWPGAGYIGWIRHFFPSISSENMYHTTHSMSSGEGRG